MSEVKTSVTHPLRIDAVTPLGTHGAIGMTLCPGRAGSSAEGGSWRRDIDADLAAIAAWRPALVVTLIEPHEYRTLEIEDFEERVRASGLPWRFAPIVDQRAPDAAFESTWLELGERARGHLASGERVLLHCRAGLGRTGVVAAMLLMDFGELLGDAMRRIRALRHGAIETSPQERYLERYVPARAK